MNDIIQVMIEKYNCKTKEQYVNAFKEIVQEIALYSLSQTNFFDNAAFYGGTALRIYYGLDRFSEDLDFSLCAIDKNFSLEKYFEVLTNSFKKLGLNFTCQIKEKTVESNVQSAFLKGNTLEHILLISPVNDISKHIQQNETIKIKFEIDTNPPSGATYEYRYSSLPLSYKIKTYDESSLFAGKIHAVLCRSWKKRIKGRDLYDFEFYVKNGCLLNIEHLEKRMIQSGHLGENETLTLEKVKTLLKNKIEVIDFDKAKEDVLPFVNNTDKLSIWSKEYFNYLICNLKDNSIIVYKCLFDLSMYGVTKIIEQAEIKKIFFPNKNIKNNKLIELKKRYNNFIVPHSAIVNFGNKTNVIEEYYNIKGFGEEIYININVNIQKILMLLID